MTTTDPKRPDYTPDVVRDMDEDVRLVRDVSKGTTHMRRERTRYLPQHTGEEGSDYNRRLQMAVLFNALDRTVKGLSGMVFRRDPVLGDDVPEVIRQHCENIDNAGTHLDAYARALFEDGLLTGHAGILVDAPAVEALDGDGQPRRLSDAEEKALGVRPYWVMVPKDRVRSWRTEVREGRTVLVQLVIHEPTTVPDEEFGEKTVDRYRVYRLPEGAGPTVEVWEIVDDKPALHQQPTPVRNQIEIPFYPFYSNKAGYLESSPPLLDLAHTNVAHYQTLADHRYCLHISNVLTPVISGVPTDAVVGFGPNRGIKIPDPQGKAYYLEPQGNAFDTNLRQLQEFKGDMAAAGLSMLEGDKRAAETAEAKRLDRSVEESTLAAAARSLQDALEAALNFHARFLRLPSGGSVQVNREFEDQSLTAEEVERYSQLVLRNQWSLDTLWAKLEEGGVNPEDFDADVERERIESSFDPNVVPLPTPAAPQEGKEKVAA